MKSIFALRKEYSSCSMRCCAWRWYDSRNAASRCRTPAIRPVSGSSSSTKPDLGQLQFARIGDQNGDHVVLAIGHLHRTDVAVVKEIADHETDRFALGDRHQELHRAGDVGRLADRSATSAARPNGSQRTLRRPAIRRRGDFGRQFRFVGQHFADHAQRSVSGLCAPECTVRCRRGTTSTRPCRR